MTQRPSEKALAIVHHRNSCASRGGRFACSCQARKDALTIDALIAAARAEAIEECLSHAREIADNHHRDQTRPEYERDFQRGIGALLVSDRINALVAKEKA
jgi:hypothetical protein